MSSILKPLRHFKLPKRQQHITYVLKWPDLLQYDSDLFHIFEELIIWVKHLLILMQIFHFSRRFFSKMLIAFTLSSLDLLVLQMSSGAHLKGLDPIIVVVH